MSHESDLNDRSRQRSFGLYCGGGDVMRVPEFASLAESLGFDLLGILDTQVSIFRDVIVALSAAAMSTSRIRIGPLASNPLTRHPAVAANAIATLRELAGPRVFWGLATGDSAVWSIGMRPASLERLRSYADTVSHLTAGRPTVHDDVPLHLAWPRFEIPIYFACEGPKVLQLAGRMASGVFIATGLGAETVNDALEDIRKGASESGRELRDLDLWVRVHISIARDRAAAVEAAKPSLAATAHSVFRRAVDQKRVPSALLEPLRRLAAEYRQITHYDTTGTNPNGRLLDRLGLTEYVMGRFALAGTADDCARGIKELWNRGIQRILVRPVTHDALTFLKLWGAEVLPLL